MTEPPAEIATKPRAGFFPGSTIGNFEPHEAAAFLRRAGRILGAGSVLVIGVESDMLFPIHEQAAIAQAFEQNAVPTRFVRLPSLEGHDAFLVDIPRFSSPGVLVCPSSRSRLKFCIFRAPTWKQSMYGIIDSICAISITSVITSSPASSATSRSSFKPSSPMP